MERLTRRTEAQKALAEMERECNKYEGMTNADRIRYMTDEELARFLAYDTDDIIDCDSCKEPVNEYGSCIGDCINEFLR